MAALRLLCDAMPSNRKATRATRGGSIIEMLTAIGISTILLGIAVPRFVEMRGPWALRQTTQLVASEFGKARMRAIARNKRYRFTYSSTAKTYTIDCEVTAGTWTTEFTGQLPTGASIEVPATTPIFDSRGMLNQTAAIGVSMAGYTPTRTVTINVLGNVSIT
jgi:type II secretory pathway pseudopilin PulG